MSRPLVVVLVLALLPPAGRSAHAVTVDGTLDAAYGPAIVVQTVQTGLSGGQITGDNTDGHTDFANGSELDAAYAFIAGGVLHLFLPGNLAMRYNVNQNRTVGHTLDFFVDAIPGGQNTLSGLGSGHPLNGMTFDAGFEADYWFQLEGDAGGSQGPPFWTARQAALAPHGSGSLVTLGSTPSLGPGTLVGGSNPHGIRATIDNRNVAGVTFGCGASSGAGVTTGIEWAIPLAAIGSPNGCVRVTAIVRNGSAVSNQVLAPVPVGTCPLGNASSVNFAGIAGDQFLTVCPSAAAVADGRTGGALRFLGPNPSGGERLRVAFSLPAAAVARLQLVDAAGRTIGERPIAGDASGGGVVEFAPPAPLTPGVYWVRLVGGAERAALKIAVVR